LNTAGDVVSIVLSHLTAEVVSVVEKMQVTRAGAVSPPYSVRFAHSVGERGLAPSLPKLKKGENTTQPHFDARSVVYDKHSATFHRDHVSLSTVNGRVECNYVIPDDTDGTSTGEYLLNEDFEFRMSTLQYDRFTESFYLYARMRQTDKSTSSVVSN